MGRLSRAAVAARHQIARDIACGQIGAAGERDQRMGMVLADAFAQRQRLGRRGMGPGRTGLVGDGIGHRRRQAVGGIQRPRSAVGRAGQFGQSGVDAGGRGVVQVGFARNAFLVAPQQSGQILRLDRAADGDGDLAHRSQHRPALHPVPRPVTKAAPLQPVADGDGPVADLLPVKHRWRQAVTLHHAAHRLGIAIGGHMIDRQDHRTSPLR